MNERVMTKAATSEVTTAACDDPQGEDYYYAPAYDSKTDRFAYRAVGHLEPGHYYLRQRQGVVNVHGERSRQAWGVLSQGFIRVTDDGQEVPVPPKIAKDAIRQERRMQEEEKTPLQIYTDSRHQIAVFECDHSETLSRYNELRMACSTAENDLRAWARENGETENDSFSVTVTCKTRRWYDADKIIELAPYVREMPGVVVQTVDKAVIERFAKAGAIDKSICEQAYHEEAMTPAVSIREKAQA